ncbi:hypothetical protein KIW84_055569 [Lathyrus oleraceus]|uniref:Glucosamine/galactosamine-6-phosphate isomerase domain-containing protein n=1 Tax=Pisum sativum TaxID=3888 RepID=A0A9D4X0U7_PEA|nr:hypothetical protein KIW84_055569 [Pisum sativum]
MRFSTGTTPKTPSLSLSNTTSHQSYTRFSFKPLRFKGLSTKSSKRFICEAVKSSMAVEVEVFEKEALAVSLAKYVADLSNKFTQQIGAFTVCLSGGSLINYLRKLSGPPYVYSIKWGKWHVFWMDKRVVPKDHEDSNYKPTFDGFLSKVKSSSILARGCRLTGELITCFDHPRSSSEPFVSDIPKASSALASYIQSPETGITNYSKLASPNGKQSSTFTINKFTPVFRSSHNQAEMIDGRVLENYCEKRREKIYLNDPMAKQGYLEMFVCTSSAEFSMLCSDVKVIGYRLPLRMTFAIEGSVELLLQVHRLHQFCNQFLDARSGLVS